MLFSVTIDHAVDLLVRWHCVLFRRLTLAASGRSARVAMES
jgi:hypothetical protein